jgi:hypothetical protein
VRARASFIPAHDAKGKPIAARWLGRFRWTFPLVATEELTKLPESSGYEVVLTIDEAGVMTACQPIRLLGKRYTRICDDVLAGSKKDITAYRVNGKPTRLKLRMTSIITYEAADAK